MELSKLSMPLHRRVFALALSLWLPLFMSGAEMIVRCPTHGGSPSAAASHGAVDGKASLADHDHGANHSAPADHGTTHNCSCPGPSCCPPAVATLPGVDIPLAHIVAVHEAITVATLDRLASEPDHLLPFATAPPAVALAPAASQVA